MLVSHFQVFSMVVEAQAFLFLANPPPPQPTKVEAPPSIVSPRAWPLGGTSGTRGGQFGRAAAQSHVTQLSDGSTGGGVRGTKGCLSHATVL